MDRQKALKLLRNELIEFEGEVDISDPEWTEILFNKRVSTLVNKRVIRTSKLPRKVRLADIIELIDSHAPSELQEHAEGFDGILRTYGEGPDKDEMKKAMSELASVIELLKKRAAEP